MNDDEMKCFVAGALISTLVMVVIMYSSLVGKDSEWRSQAIKHNAGEYNQSTGEFQWKDKILHE
mgnify:CR=1 FL=1